MVHRTSLLLPIVSPTKCTYDLSTEALSLLRTIGFTLTDYIEQARLLMMITRKTGLASSNIGTNLRL
jgi:hypothetical protein